MYDPRDFTVGGVLRQTSGLLRRHAGEFTACGFLLTFLPSVATSAGSLNTLRSFKGSGQLRDTTTSVSFLGGSGTLIGVLTSVILFGIVVRAGLRDARGERAGIGPDVAASLKLLLPNLFIAVLFYLGMTIGFLLLIVPGIMLLCAWCVVIPAYMAERQGVFHAFGRSRALTAGYRWRIFGLLLLYGFVTAVLGGANVFLTLSLIRNGLDGSLLWTFRIVIAALSAITNLAIFAGATACYFELSRVKGGVLSSDLIESFT